MGKIYTKSGDGGTTTLVGGKRIRKQDDLLEAYGTCDELNSFIGLSVAEIENQYNGEDSMAEITGLLRLIQNTLFDIGGLLATEPERWEEYWPERTKLIDQETVGLENQIDKWEALLPTIRQFIIPGGDKSTASCHVCRTVCRRLERRMARISDNSEVYLPLIRYVNRLSDFFFILARFLHQIHSITVNYYTSTR